MNTVSVVDHSGYGHTTNQAQAIGSGLDSLENVQANLIAIDHDGELGRRVAIVIRNLPR
jgi:hypothetical protein